MRAQPLPNHNKFQTITGKLKQQYFIHSLKRGDRLSKKRATKKRQIPSCVMGKSDSDIYYNKISGKAATK